MAFHRIVTNSVLCYAGPWLRAEVWREVSKRRRNPGSYLERGWVERMTCGKQLETATAKAKLVFNTVVMRPTDREPDPLVGTGALQE
jgi:hypothetical protein